jgi:hypothetical protein
LMFVFSVVHLKFYFKENLMLNAYNNLFYSNIKFEWF